MGGSQWVRLDVDYLTNPKMLAVGTDGVLLHLATILWCADHETDGRVPKSALPVLGALAGVKSPARVANRLADAGLYVANGDGWHLHDFERMNGSESEAEIQRVRWRNSQAAYRAKRKAAAALSERNGETNGETNG